MNECTCYKGKKCQVCLEWHCSTMFKEVRELIQKYPQQVNELFYDNNHQRATSQH